jgi:large subunit ribosomal protein L15
MQIHELTLSKKRKRGQRVGRGGKRGIYSGRGNKGQKARTNHRLKLKRIGSGLARHVPKLGGFVSLRPRSVAVDIKRLEEKFSNGELVTPITLKSKGIIKSINYPVKIVGNTELTKKLSVRECLTTASSKKSIEKAGGKVIEIKKIEVEAVKK